MRSIRRYRRRTLWHAVVGPIYALIGLSILLAYVGAAIFFPRMSDLHAVVFQVIVLTIVLTLSGSAVWRRIYRAKNIVDETVQMIFFRPFRPKQSRLAASFITPRLAKLGSVFTVFSDGFPDPGAPRRSNSLEALFAPDGGHFGDQFDIASDGKVTFGWKEAVFRHLLQRNLAVIDVSEGAAGLKWEIALARSLLHPERIIYVADAQPDAGHLAAVFDYDQHAASQTDPMILLYGDGFTARRTFSWRMRARILSALAAPVHLDAAEQQRAISAALPPGTASSIDVIGSQVPYLIEALQESDERVWWYVRQAVVEGMASGVYWLNLPGFSSTADVQWVDLTPTERVGRIAAQMRDTYSTPLKFEKGPRASNERWYAPEH